MNSKTMDQNKIVPGNSVTKYSRNVESKEIKEQKIRTSGVMLIEVK